MRRKINQQLILTSLFATMLTMGLMLFLFWQLFEQQVFEDLKAYTALLERTSLYENKKTYQVKLDSEVLRVTWLAADGYVLGDTQTDQTQMDNHADRPEFIQALEQGEGYDIRESETLNENMYYYAIRMEDGTVLRLAKSARSGWNIILNAIPGMLLAFAMMALFCVLVARAFAKNIIRPLKELAANLDKNEGKIPYKELTPFVTTIRTQHENILRGAKLRQEFTANVTHELKTPLTVISGYSELLEAGLIKGDEVTRYAKEIRHNSHRLLSLINDILHLSEMDRAEYEVPMQPIRLSELAKSCVEELLVNAEKRKVSLRYIGENVVVYGNKELLEELIWNLCENAIRYNVDGGMVKVQVEKIKEEVYLTVSDTGIGISKEHQERVFERFYRVDKSRSKESGGTGLGLAIVKHIVAQHEAQLILESELGKGTKITVCFACYKE